MACVWCCAHSNLARKRFYLSHCPRTHYALLVTASRQFFSSLSRFSHFLPPFAHCCCWCGCRSLLLLLVDAHFRYSRTTNASPFSRYVLSTANVLLRHYVYKWNLFLFYFDSLHANVDVKTNMQRASEWMKEEYPQHDQTENTIRIQQKHWICAFSQRLQLAGGESEETEKKLFAILLTLVVAGHNTANEKQKRKHCASVSVTNFFLSIFIRFCIWSTRETLAHNQLKVKVIAATLTHRIGMAHPALDYYATTAADRIKMWPEHDTRIEWIRIECVVYSTNFSQRVEHKNGVIHSHTDAVDRKKYSFRTKTTFAVAHQFGRQFVHVMTEHIFIFCENVQRRHDISSHLSQMWSASSEQSFIADTNLLLNEQMNMNRPIYVHRIA